ncbi:hypothetical protein BC835DRAFT_1411076 [Cytidiella melzeri]|nr:hypothetical protein BC835DRAFT_1411076 [Cytidiella melzeri]
MVTFFLPQFLALSEKGRHSFIIPGDTGSYGKDTHVHIMELVALLPEFELHDHQGTREQLSKFWMPLDKSTEGALAGLIECGLQIPVGNAKPT